MIEFYGALDGAAKNFMLKKQFKLQFFISIFVAIIFLVPILIFSYPWTYITLLLICIPLTILLVSLLPPDKATKNYILSKKIFVDLGEQMIVRQHTKGETNRSINSVTRVLDYGEWYYLLFEFDSRDIYFVCQKSLLTKGSLEEFEALFEGKIEKRY